jgi:hypothetical protein
VIVAGLSLSGHRFRDHAGVAQNFAASKPELGLPIVAKM